MHTPVSPFSPSHGLKSLREACMQIWKLSTRHACPH